MNTLKILVFAPTYYPQMGGGERSMYELYSRLPSLGINVDLITPNLGGKEFEEPVTGFKIYRVGKKRKNLIAKFLLNQLAQYNKAKQLIKENDYYLVHNQFVLPNGIVSYLISREIHKPLITSEHHYGTGRDISSPEDNPKFVNPIIRFIFRKSDLIITTGLTQDNYLRWHFGAYPKNAIAIRLGSPDIKSIPEEQKLNIKEKLGYSNKKIVFSIGRITTRKYFNEMISAAQIVCEKIPNVLFIIAGKGEDLECLRKEVIDRKLDSSVKFIGFVDDRTREDLYLCSDVFAYCSKFEGSGIVYTEAMSYSIPVVAYENEAVKDIIKNENYGLLTPRDPKKLAERIIDLLTDEKKKKSIVENCYNLIRNVYNWDNYALSYALEIRKLVEKNETE